MLKVFINKDEFIFIDIRMCLKLTSIWKLPFEDHGMFEY